MGYPSSSPSGRSVGACSGTSYTWWWWPLGVLVSGRGGGGLRGDGPSIHYPAGTTSRHQRRNRLAVKSGGEPRAAPHTFERPGLGEEKAGREESTLDTRGLFSWLASQPGKAGDVQRDGPCSTHGCPLLFPMPRYVPRQGQERVVVGER